MWDDDFTSIPTFQEQHMTDLDNLFFNVESKEFIAPHQIGGIRGKPPVTCNVAVDFEQYSGRNIKDAVENIIIGGLIFFIKKDEWLTNFGDLPNIGSSLKFDSRQYQVEDVVDVYGALKITLSAIEAGGDRHMTNEIQILIDQADIEKKLDKLKNIQDGVPRATMRAMNRTVKGMKTDAWGQVKKNYTTKQKDFYNRLTVEQASMDDLSIALRSTGRPLSLIKFKNRANRKSNGGGTNYIGRSFRRAERSRERGKDIGKRKSGSGGWNRGRKSVFSHVRLSNSGGYTGGFVATNTTNNLKAIWRRTGEEKKIVSKGRYKDMKKEPIDRRFGPGSVQMLNNEETRKQIQTKAAERFYKELDHQIDHLLDQQKG